MGLRAKALHSLQTLESGADKVFVFNTLAFPRAEVVELPEGLPGTQTTSSGRQLGLVSAPALGYAVQTRLLPAKQSPCRKPRLASCWKISI